ncbi:carbamoyltransferase C-terminal domain-containing protein [Streptomyces sp. HMX87]|uniref:carbamoyltransferase C-terminal domain-containing protein n=1 Tax=Streptomyces sp. HMX87 TaxID=3390849 RepID=UPI003A8B2A24
MIVLGCDGRLLGHDAGASLLVDGELVAAVGEQRLNRAEKTTDFPVNAVQWCLDQAGLTFSDVDLIAVPRRFSTEALNQTLSGIESAPMTPSAGRALAGGLSKPVGDAIGPEAILTGFAGRTGPTPDPDQVVFVPQHLAHAMTGYYIAGMRDAAFLVSDGRTEVFSSLTGEIRDGRIRVFEESSIGSEYSIGRLFAAITRYLGFVPDKDEHKVMGLAGFAEPPAPNPFLEHIVQLHADGRYTFCRPLAPDGHRDLGALFEKHFGPFEDTLEHKAWLAAAAQQMLTAVTRHQVRALEARTDLGRLLFEGGVALNSLNNTPLFEGSRFEDMDVSFGAGGTGLTIGAAVHAWLNPPDGLARVQRAPTGVPQRGALGAAVHAHFYGADTPERKTAPPVTPYLGPEYDDAAIEQALGEFAGRVTWSRLDDEEVVSRVARLLTGKVAIGWFEGRIEHGPRALGHRSILANPQFPEIKDIIDDRGGHRDPFHSCAPLVLEEDAPKIFDMGRKSRSPYKAFAFPVRPEFRAVIPGATHVDGTSRIQTITDRHTPRLAALLRRFAGLTGVPCLINADFNVAGEPLVCAPTDALDCFLGTEIDHLVLGNHLVSKTESFR